jgi:uncharacterized protein with HEPN domain
MYKSYVPYLQHILDECLYVRSVITDDMQMEAFLRDKLVHDYMGVNYYIVWDVAKNIIPTLTGQIQTIIDSYNAQGDM